MKLVGKSIIGKKKAKKGFKYPIVRSPLEFREIIGKEAKIYQLDDKNFLISLDQQLDNLFEFVKVNKNIATVFTALGIDINSILEEKLREILIPCGGRDLNPRTPSGQGLKPCAFSWLGNPRYISNISY